MPKGPPVHEIFNPPMPGKEAAFHYQKKETKQQMQLGTKKTLAPLPPMKKFGGYKPKILGGGDNLIPITSHSAPSPEPPVQNRRPAPVLTKPKPFIIGDKDTPMILSTMDDDLDNNEVHAPMEDMHIYEKPEYRLNGNGAEENNNNNNNMKNTNNNIMRLSNDESFNNNKNISSDIVNSVNHTQSYTTNDESFTVQNENNNLIETNTVRDPTTFAMDNPVFHTTDTGDSQATENDQEPEGVFIPAPDYEEDERTMDFTDEDPDDVIEEQRIEQKLKQIRQKQQQQNGLELKIYDGEDLSRYLSDDEDDDIYRNRINTMPARLNQKHGLFKSNPHNTNTTGTRKFNKKQSPAFNSVRNFSLADSKYATSGKVGGKKQTEVSGDYESFLCTSQQGEGYETFLRSKHGMGVDASPAHLELHPQWNRRHGDGIWKKLTVRLKHKLQRSGYDMKDH